MVFSFSLLPRHGRHRDTFSKNFLRLRRKNRFWRSPSNNKLCKNGLVSRRASTIAGPRFFLFFFFFFFFLFLFFFLPLFFFFFCFFPGTTFPSAERDPWLLRPGPPAHKSEVPCSHQPIITLKKTPFVGSDPFFLPRGVPAQMCYKSSVRSQFRRLPHRLSVSAFPCRCFSAFWPAQLMQNGSFRSLRVATAPQSAVFGDGKRQPG